MTTGSSPTRLAPEHEPFVIRPSPLKRGVLGWLASVASMMLVSVPLAVLLQQFVVLWILAIVAVAALVIAFPLGLLLTPLVPRPPLVAVGPGGVWVSRGRSKESLVWQAWESIDRIDIHRRGLTRVLQVQVRTSATRRDVYEVVLWGLDHSVAELRKALATYNAAAYR